MSHRIEDPSDALLHQVAEQITPLFETGGASKPFARKAALSALAAYHPESRADFVNIARILAFSLASLAALGIAAIDDLPSAQKMRYFGRANALNRSADQTERMMMQRRRDQRANPPAEIPAEIDPQHAAAPNHDAALDSIVEEAMALYRTQNARRPTNDPAAAKPQPPSQTQPPAQPKLVPPQPPRAETAIHAAGPGAKTSYKQTLLHRSAMPTVLTGAQPHPPS